MHLIMHLQISLQLQYNALELTQMVLYLANAGLKLDGSDESSVTCCLPSNLMMQIFHALGVICCKCYPQ